MTQQTYYPPSPAVPESPDQHPLSVGALARVPGVDSHGNPISTLGLIVGIEHVEDVEDVQTVDPAGRTVTTQRPTTRRVASVVLLPEPTRVPLDDLTP